MTRTRIYADVDGTLALDADLLTEMPQGFTYEHTFHRYGRAAIAFHPQRIQRLAALSRKADWLWLTSWGEHAVKNLAPLWGVEGSRALPVMDSSNDPRQFWKLDLIEAIQTVSPSRFVFIEDRAIDEYTAGDGWWQEQVESGSALLVCSDETTGVTDQQVAEVERFVRAS